MSWISSLFERFAKRDVDTQDCKKKKNNLGKKIKNGIFDFFFFVHTQKLKKLSSFVFKNY